MEMEADLQLVKKNYWRQLKMEKIKGLDKFAKNYAIYRNFMQFVKDKYPKIHKEYWKNITEEKEILNRMFPKAKRLKNE